MNIWWVNFWVVRGDRDDRGGRFRKLRRVYIILYILFCMYCEACWLYVFNACGLYVLLCVQVVRVYMSMNVWYININRYYIIFTCVRSYFVLCIYWDICFNMYNIFFIRVRVFYVWDTLFIMCNRYFIFKFLLLEN